MNASSGEVHLSDDEVAVVLQAIGEGRVRDLDDVPYDPAVWDAEAVRDWLERTHRPTRAHEIVRTLRNGRTIKSRPFAPTVSIVLHALMHRITQLEQEMAALKQRVSGGS